MVLLLLLLLPLQLLTLPMLLLLLPMLLLLLPVLLLLPPPTSRVRKGIVCDGSANRLGRRPLLVGERWLLVDERHLCRASDEVKRQGSSLLAGAV